MTVRQWERVESVRRRPSDAASYAGEDPCGQVWRSIFGEGPLIEDCIEPMAIVYWCLAQLAFLGEWLPRGPLEGVLGGNGHALGLSLAEITSCFDHVLEIVEQVGPARPGGAD
jgi:hypothetical protein